MQTRKARLRRIFFSIIILGSLGSNIPQLFSLAANAHLDALIINEFLAANRMGHIDEDGDHSDWIEIYNPGPYAVNLAGWSLTDDPNQPEKWVFPDITLGSQEYLLVFASGKDRKPTQSKLELHTNFKLSQKGEFLGLYNIRDSQFVSSPAPSDEKEFSQQFEDIAYGRYSHDQADELAYGYLTIPTPGRPNDETALRAGPVAPVTFSLKRGFYEAPFRLELSTTTPGSIIRYTTDGSQPTEAHGTIYTTPISINSTTLLRAAAFKPYFLPSADDTHSYIFLDDVLNQPKSPPGFPKSWGAHNGSSVTADYEMDPRIVNNSRYNLALKQALTSIPTLSIVTETQNFYDLYANPRRKGRAWERPVSVEFIDQTQPGFQIKAGLRIQGDLGRSENVPKHPLRLFFRASYGAAKLKYPLFPNSPVEEFDSLILRSGVNRSYAGWPESTHEITTYTRDEWLRSSQIAMSGSGSHGLFVHLYLNGLYWGLYNVVERPDDSFMSSYFGGEKDDWQAVSHAETVNNSSDRFKTLHQLAREGQLEDPAKYTTINSYLDVPHFIDYLILNWYAGNLDWGFNNWYAGVPNLTGQIKYFAWDGERTWYDGAEIYMELDEYNDQPNLVNPLFEALLENPDFRVAMADRMYKHLFNNGALTEANAQVRWLEINNVVEQAIIGESARWGDAHHDSPLTQDDWFEARDDVLAQMEGNVNQLITLAREAGYYPDIDPPVFNQHGNEISGDFKVIMTMPSPGKGTIYYTTDGSDPRLQVTATVAPTAMAYNSPIELTATTQVKARILDGNIWSALQDATFRVIEPDTRLLGITEIMYNPVGGDDYEFLELSNIGSVKVDLSRMSFEGIRFTFPPDAASLAPGEFIVLARNPVAFAHQHPGVTVTGNYDGQLSNKGEKITMKDADDNVIVSFEYDDENGWPITPDGRGDSLVLNNLDGDPNNPDNWRASTNLNGSPGVDEP